jgi:hypothetical protein
MMLRMRRGATAWGSALVLAVIGTQVAHSVGYRLATPDDERRELVLNATGHGYLSHAPLALALGFGLLAALLAAEARAAVRGSTGSPCAWVFLLVAPVVFVAQEHIERLVHDGSFPLTILFDGAFELGLALQLPFALAAYGLARLLLSAARSLGKLLGPPGGSPRSSSRLVVVPPRIALWSPRVRALALGYSERGPPRLV